MTEPVDQARRRFAEELRAAANLRSEALVDALARVPRDRFLGPGPWTIRGEGDRVPRATADADPRHVHQNVSVAIDQSRDLYNGQPGLVARWLDALEIAPGDHALHVGCATGYYTAVIAELTGPDGRVTGVEVDSGLADRARVNLAPWPWVSVRSGDGRTGLPEGLDVILVHAGATHLIDEWLDAVRDGGRILVPLTCTIPGMPASLSKGVVLSATRRGDGWTARVDSIVMIYALVGVRDEGMNARLGQALRAGQWSTVSRIRRDPHEPDARCWLHGKTNCIA